MYKKELSKKPVDPICESAKEFVTTWISKTHKNTVSNVSFNIVGQHNRNILLTVSFSYDRKTITQYYVLESYYSSSKRCHVAKINDDDRFTLPKYGNIDATNETIKNITKMFEELYNPALKHKRKRPIAIPAPEIKCPTARDLIDRMVSSGHDGIIKDIISKLFGYEVNFIRCKIRINSREIQITDNILRENNTADGLLGYEFNLPINQKDRFIRIRFDKDNTLCSIEIHYLNYNFHIYSDKYFISPIDKRDNGIDVKCNKETIDTSNTNFGYGINLGDSESLIIYYSFSQENGRITLPNDRSLLNSLNNPDLVRILNNICENMNPRKDFYGHSDYNISKYNGYSKDMAAIMGMIFFSNKHKQMIIKALREILGKQESEIPDTFNYICRLLRQENLAQIFGNITPENNKLDTVNTYDTIRPLFKESTKLYVSPLNNHNLRLPNSVLIYSGIYDSKDEPWNFKSYTNYLEIEYNPLPQINEFRVVCGYKVNGVCYFLNMTFNPNKSNRFLLELQIGDDTIQIKRSSKRFNEKTLDNYFELIKNKKVVLDDFSFDEAKKMVKGILTSNEFVTLVYTFLKNLGIKEGVSPVEVYTKILHSLCMPGYNELIDSMANTNGVNNYPISFENAITNLERRIINSIPTIKDFNKVASNFVDKNSPTAIEESTLCKSDTNGDTKLSVRYDNTGSRFLFQVSRTTQVDLSKQPNNPHRQANIRPELASYSYHFAIEYNIGICSMILELPVHRFSCKYGEEIHIARKLVTIKIIPSSNSYSLSGDGVMFDINSNESSLYIPVNNTFWKPSKEIMGFFCSGPGTKPSTVLENYVYDSTTSGHNYFPAARAIHYIINDSIGFKKILLTLFKELGLDNLDDLPDILESIFDLLPIDFITGFFGSEENKNDFVKGLIDLSTLNVKESEIKNKISSYFIVPEEISIYPNRIKDNPGVIIMANSHDPDAFYIEVDNDIIKVRNSRTSLSSETYLLQVNRSLMSLKICLPHEISFELNKTEAGYQLLTNNLDKVTVLNSQDQDILGRHIEYFERYFNKTLDEFEVQDLINEYINSDLFREYTTLLLKDMLEYFKSSPDNASEFFNTLCESNPMWEHLSNRQISTNKIENLEKLGGN